jgi:uncharacterized protein YecE (DUF72 family)
MRRPRFRFGTSSWSETSWVGPFYPPGTKPAAFLSCYASRFDAVEADVSYYRIPSASMVQGWERKTPAGFSLCAKFPRSIVHGGTGARPDPERVLVPEAVAEDVEQFLAAMRLLGPKCGPLVLQFPYFNREAFADPRPFLDRLERFLGELPKEFRYAVEVRNRTWIGADLLELLRAQRVALVWVDLLYMPHPADLAREHELVTTDFVYARLIGDRKKVEAATERFDRVVIDQRPRLERWAELLRGLPADVEEVFAFANNHYAGHGPATIRELAALVRGEEPIESGGGAAGSLPF